MTALLKQPLSGLIRLCFAFAASLLYSPGTFAQTGEWTLLNESDGLRISYQTRLCSDEVNLLLLRVENETTEDLSAGFVLTITQDGREPLTYTFAEHTYRANSVSEGQCGHIGESDLLRVLNDPLIAPQVSLQKN